MVRQLVVRELVVGQQLVRELVVGRGVGVMLRAIHSDELVRSDYCKTTQKSYQAYPNECRLVLEGMGRLDEGQRGPM